MRTSRNPFRFEGPVPRADLIGRESELEQVVRFALDRRVLSVAAPRRYGKTSLLRGAAEVLHEDHGFIVAHVDLQALAGLEDFVARFGTAWRLATAHNRRARRAFEQLAGGLSSFGLTVLGSGVQFQRRDKDQQNALAAAHALLDLPGEIEEPVLVVLDEFQDLHAAWPAGEGVLRSHTQSPTQANKVAYAFAGSEPSLLAAAFEDVGRAYYQQVQRVQVSRLSSAVLARGISEAFARTDREVGAALAPLVDLVDGHPQRAMLLANLLWERTPLGQRADGHWSTTLAAARRWVADEAEGIWQSLTPVQRQALLAIIETGSATTRSGNASRSSAQRAAAALQARGLVEPQARSGPRGGVLLQLVDPLLGDWIIQQRG